MSSRNPHSISARCMRALEIVYKSWIAMQIIVGLKCKEVSEKGCLLSLLCHLFIIYFLFLNQRDNHEKRTIFVM